MYALRRILHEWKRKWQYCRWSTRSCVCACRSGSRALPELALGTRQFNKAAGRDLGCRQLDSSVRKVSGGSVLRTWATQPTVTHSLSQSWSPIATLS